jgi:hypothetical protein
MPTLSGHISLVTNEFGQHRLIVLGRRTIAGTMYGILTTLQVGRGSQLVPVACPVALMKLDRLTDPAIGLVASGAPEHAGYRDVLAAVTKEDFVRFYG